MEYSFTLPPYYKELGSPLSGGHEVRGMSREGMVELRNLLDQLLAEKQISSQPCLSLYETDPTRPIWMKDGMLFGWCEGVKKRIVLRGKLREILEEIVQHPITSTELLEKFFKRDVFEKEATLNDVYNAIKYLNRKLSSFECEIGVSDNGFYASGMVGFCCLPGRFAYFLG